MRECKSSFNNAHPHLPIIENRARLNMIQRTTNGPTPSLHFPRPTVRPLTYSAGNFRASLYVAHRRPTNSEEDQTKRYTCMHRAVVCTQQQTQAVLLFPSNNHLPFHIHRSKVSCSFSPAPSGLSCLGWCGLPHIHGKAQEINGSF